MGLPQAKASVREEFPPEASLLAEIERLKRELAIARARVGELEARADVDPLLDVLNRRGFERELKRALAHT
ncbi:MAG: GGDEF domain-containing protein, partial [Pseudolabrys sp.]